MSLKRKASALNSDGKESSPAPIVFPCASYAPDIRLFVFDQEFQVHSTLLKIHSAFFRKFLDSPDKAVDESESAMPTLPPTISRARLNAPVFKYSWVTKVDDDGKGWFLVAETIQNRPYQVEKYECDKEPQIQAFHKLLLAIYSMPYTIENFEQLETLVNQADYYCALRMVSCTIANALIESKGFSITMALACFDKVFDNILACAAKLRSAMLFRECVSWVDSSSIETIRNPNLRRVVGYTHGQTLALQMKVTAAVTLAFKRDFEDLEAGQYPNHPWIHFRGHPQQLHGCLSEVLWKRIIERYGGNSILDDLWRLVTSKRRLDYSDWFTQDSPQSYLCVYVADEDLPWDVDEMDW